MAEESLTDTIAAISTPLGEGGIGIVRISGKGALKIACRVFVPSSGDKPSGFKTHTIHYGKIIENNKVIDEVILTLMLTPKSYTREDVVEINCHGGIVALRAVLGLVLDNGARLAEPGEFTKRAFLNGRIDLAQAEAVLDIIRAKTDSALKAGTEQLKGALSAKLNNISRGLLGFLALLEANIDFPEEETNPANLKEVREGLDQISNELKGLLESARHGRVLREGIRAVICGKPNAGKSSLLNAILKQERSIVTPIAGTTRDTIEEIIDIKGIPVRIVDTAGIIEPRDLAEKKALRRSRESIDSAELVLLLFDGSRRLSREDRELISRLKRKTVIAIINKADLKQRIEKNTLLKDFTRLIEVSAKKLKNINLLEEEIVNSVYAGRVNAAEPVIVANLRHIGSLREVQKFIAEATDSLDNRLPPEFTAQGIKEALSKLDGILGKRFSEGLLDKIFGEFCIGK